MTLQTLSLEEGKYELRFDAATGALCAYRHGEPWQDYTGSKFIYLLMQKALAAAEAQPSEAVAIYRGHRSTPEGTKEFWGVAEKPLPEGTKLYAAPVAQPVVPQGWKLMPVKPTPGMVGAMAVEEATGSINGRPTIGIAGACLVYESALAAAPAAPAGESQNAPR